MAEIEKKPVKCGKPSFVTLISPFTCYQNDYRQMLIVDKMDKAGYHAVECWEADLMPACVSRKRRSMERLRKLRDGFKNTKLQMLFRGGEYSGIQPLRR